MQQRVRICKNTITTLHCCKRFYLRDGDDDDDRTTAAELSATGATVLQKATKWLSDGRSGTHCPQRIELSWAEEEEHHMLCRRCRTWLDLQALQWLCMSFTLNNNEAGRSLDQIDGRIWSPGQSFQVLMDSRFIIVKSHFVCSSSRGDEEWPRICVRVQCTSFPLGICINKCTILFISILCWYGDSL